MSKTSMSMSSKYSRKKYISIDMEGYELSPRSKKVYQEYQQWKMDPNDELLVDGYARECGVDLFLFAMDIKYLITIYYTKKRSKSILVRSITAIKNEIDRQKMEIKQRELNMILNRKKAAKSERKNNYPRYIATYCFSLLFIALAIISIYIAHHFNDHICNNYNNHKHFIMIGGYTLLCHMAYNLIMPWIEILFYCLIQHGLSGFNYFYGRSTQTYLIYVIPAFIMCIFYCIWSIIGIHIYMNEMTSQCQNSFIGEIMVSWCIIMSIVSLLIICCPICGWLMCCIINLKLKMDDD